MPEPVEKKSGQEMVNEFFNNLPKEDKSPEANIFGKTEAPKEAPVTTTEEEEESVEDSIKNRRHRRLEAKLQAEREANIALSERVKVLSEVEKFSKETPEVDPDIAKMFDASDIGKENALRLSRKLTEIEGRAEQRALQRINELQEKEVEEVKEAGNFIDTQLDSLEDQFKVSFYGSKKADTLRNEFLQFIEEISPKDDSGEIKDYADFETSFETFQKLQAKEKPDNSRQREIASRSMQRSQSGSSAPKVRTPGWDGWKVDLGIE